MTAVPPRVRAVLVPRFGGPEVLEVGAVARPVLVPGTVLVRVSAAAVSNTDVLLRSGAQRRFLDGVPPPHVPGMDLCGVVLETADDRWPVGARVIAVVSAWRAQGGAQQDVVQVPAASVAPAPEGLTDVEAATLGMNGLTALACLEASGLGPGGVLAVTGAAGAVGAMVVQVAASRGLTVVADAGEDDEALVASLGAHQVVPRGEPGRAQVLEAHPDGVDAVVDAAVLGSAALPVLRDGGRLVTVRPVLGLDPGRGITTAPVFVPDHLQDTASLALVSQLAANGVLTARVAQVLAPDRAAEAHRAIEAGGLRGRPVLDLSLA